MLNQRNIEVRPLKGPQKNLYSIYFIGNGVWVFLVLSNLSDTTLLGHGANLGAHTLQASLDKSQLLVHLEFR